MPVGPNRVTDAAAPVTTAVADAAWSLYRAGSDFLTTGHYRDDLDGARDVLEKTIREARRDFHDQLRAALIPAAARAWLTGAQALNSDVHAAGVDADGVLDEALAGLRAYLAGTASFGTAVERLPDADGDLRSAAAQLGADLDQAFTAAARSLEQTLQDASATTGADDADRLAAAASIWNRFLDRGLTVPFGERRMSVNAYTRALTVTRLTAAGMSGYCNRATAAGTGFVAVSVSARECAMCGPWEGRLLARSRAVLARASASDDRQVRQVTHTFDQALAGGLFHPGCRHDVTAWIEGVSVLPVHRGPAATADSGAARLRELERTVAAWDRRAAFALTGADQARARTKAAAWRTELIEHDRRIQARHDNTPPAPAPVMQAPQADPGRPMIAEPKGVLLPEGADPGNFTATMALKAFAVGAALEFTDDAARNPGGHRFTLADLQATPGHTSLRFRVRDRADNDVGGFSVTVVGPPRHPAVKATLAGADDDLARGLGGAFVTAWGGPAKPATLPRRDPKPVTGPYLHDWPRDMSGLAITDWVDNSTGINRSIEVTFADGSKGLYKPLHGDNSQLGLLGVAPDAASSSSLREVAAYRIDRALGINLTPATRWWNGPEGPGSLQRWAAPVFPGLPAVRYTDDERQRLAVFDFILGNYDRHSDNYLTTHDGRLITIDHGLSLRHRNGMDAVMRTTLQRWWPMGKPIGADFLRQLRGADTNALGQALTALGLPIAEINAMFASLANVHAFGAIMPEYQL
ncbi:hypothetical protein LO763_22890 [Glycomyces sp. A-F 0318]|uniref:phage minor capsid protein n=1 Tax=Glycomyces amatae TaxID=2881355 RepID=UPI001E2B21C0|nr:phage minor capsid protein [Glycomyces amatae]MCD0446467.1 hypothetical protein [Glycomyces amatae]